MNIMYEWTLIESEKFIFFGFREWYDEYTWVEEYEILIKFEENLVTVYTHVQEAAYDHRYYIQKYENGKLISEKICKEWTGPYDSEFCEEITKFEVEVELPYWFAPKTDKLPKLDWLPEVIKKIIEDNLPKDFIEAAK